jgi:hypothetical protein
MDFGIDRTRHVSFNRNLNVIRRSLARNIAMQRIRRFFEMPVFAGGARVSETIAHPVDGAVGTVSADEPVTDPGTMTSCTLLPASHNSRIQSQGYEQSR